MKTNRDKKKKSGTNRRGARPALVAAVSLGCPKNTVDTEVMLGALAVAGCEFTAEPAAADIVIVNTCGFIRDAIEESEDVITQIAALKQERPGMRLVVAGCLAQRERDALKSRYPEIDLLVGASSYQKIVELLDSNAPECFDPLTFIHDHSNPRLLATPPWTAYLKIAEGCSNRCSYCAIPSLRGDYRSRRPESLLREAADLAAIGVRELIIVAQDTTRYGADLGLRNALPDLLRRLAGIDSIHWIRLMYTYPELIDAELARAIADTPKVCRYIDMPIQHIDAGILKSMNRRGGPDAIRRAIDLLRDAAPDVCLRSTVLIGFPGETNAAFRRLLDFIREARFDRLGAFAYSPEAGTPAADMRKQVPEKAKQKRVEELMQIQEEISAEKNAEFIGRALEVLVESVPGPGDDPGTLSTGRSYRDTPDIDGAVHFPGPASPGGFIIVNVTESDSYDLFGSTRF